jgi:hypothetical protein
MKETATAVATNGRKSGCFVFYGFKLSNTHCKYGVACSVCVCVSSNKQLKQQKRNTPLWYWSDTTYEDMKQIKISIWGVLLGDAQEVVGDA